MDSMGIPTAAACRATSETLSFGVVTTYTVVAVYGNQTPHRTGHKARPHSKREGNSEKDAVRQILRKTTSLIVTGPEQSNCLYYFS